MSKPAPEGLRVYADLESELDGRTIKLTAHGGTLNVEVNSFRDAGALFILFMRNPTLRKIFLKWRTSLRKEKIPARLSISGKRIFHLA